MRTKIHAIHSVSSSHLTTGVSVLLLGSTFLSLLPLSWTRPLLELLLLAFTPRLPPPLSPFPSLPSLSSGCGLTPPSFPEVSLPPCSTTASLATAFGGVGSSWPPFPPRVSSDLSVVEGPAKVLERFSSSSVLCVFEVLGCVVGGAGGSSFTRYLLIGVRLSLASVFLPAEGGCGSN